MAGFQVTTEALEEKAAKSGGDGVWTGEISTPVRGGIKLDVPAVKSANSPAVMSNVTGAVASAA